MEIECGISGFKAEPAALETEIHRLHHYTTVDSTAS